MSKRIRGTMAELLPKPEKEITNENKPKPKRVRRFCLTTYIDPEAVERFIRRSAWVQHFAMCTHNRDYEADGQPKQIHTHIILYTYNAHTSSGIRKNFDVFSAEYYSKLKLDPQNTLTQECHSVVSQFRYLRHLDDPDKAPYEDNEVITDNDLYWKELCRTNGMNDSSTNTGLQMFDDLIEGVSTREMICRYGKEYIYHSRSFKECMVDHMRENGKDDEWNEVMLETYFRGLLDNCKSIKPEQVDVFFRILEYLFEESQKEQKATLTFSFAPLSKHVI